MGEINLSDRIESLRAAAQTAKDNMMAYYVGNQPGQIPGLLTNGYYWWEAGAMMGQLIHHWKITGNDSLNPLISEALLHQVGENKDYRPKNWSIQLGNDDQAFWGFAVLDAAELGFPDPPASSETSWVGLAQAVFNTQAASWDNKTCNGGLRWQIPVVNPGYDYKNTMSNGGLFQIAARLARYTGNSTYADWANKTLNWLLATPLIDDRGDSWQIWDGAHVEDNCTATVPYQWSYNPGTLLMGAAYMYNYSADNNPAAEPLWRRRIELLLNTTNVFFVKQIGANPDSVMPPGDGNIITEVTCETTQPPRCNKDQPAFKGFLARWMAVTTQLAPFTALRIMPLLQASAQAAAQVCTGQAANMKLGTVCGRRWYQNVWDGQFGVGEQMSAMSVFQNNLIANEPAPKTAKTGGTSKGDPAAGSNPSASAGGSYSWDPIYSRPIRTADKVGAGVLTGAVASGFLAGCLWMIKGEDGWFSF